MANTNCNVNSFLHFLRNKCQCQNLIHIDICDDNGKLMNLGDATHCILDDFTEQRSTYILVSLEKDDNNQIKDVKPMLSNCSVLYPTLTDNLWTQYHEKDEIRSARRKKMAPNGSAKESATITVAGSVSGSSTPSKVKKSNKK